MKILKITFIALFSMAAMASCESTDIAPVSGPAVTIEVQGRPSVNERDKMTMPATLHNEEVIFPAVQTQETSQGVGIAREYVSVVE